MTYLIIYYFKMTRTLKTFLKQKKGMWKCGECKCLTLNVWRCSDEFCGCGEENNNSVNPNIQPIPAPAPAPTPIDPDDNNQTPDDNDNEPDYISLDDLNS